MSAHVVRMDAKQVMTTAERAGWTPPGASDQPGQPIAAELGLVLAEDAGVVIEGSAEELLALLDRARAAIHRAAGRNASAPKIEVLSVRHPDTATVTEVWLNGQHVTYTDTVTVVDVDPGKGHVLSEWRASAQHVAADESLSQAFRDAVTGAFEANEDSDHVMNDLD